MSEHVPWAEKCQIEWDAFLRLWKKKRWLAIVLLLTLVIFIGWSISSNWLKSQSIDQLKGEKVQLESRLRESERETRGLREIVAPLLARAAKEFPGEEINISLKKVIEKLDADRPANRPLASASATVEVVIESNSGANNHFMDSGGFLAFAKGNDALMVASSQDSFARTAGTNEVAYRAVFQMPADDKMVGQPVKNLVETQYLQIEFVAMGENQKIIKGKAIVVINSGFRLEFDVPPQKADGRRIFIRNIGDQLRNAFNK